MDTCRAISEALAFLAWNILRIRRKVILENLSHAYPDLDAAGIDHLARRMWAHLFLFVAEAAQVPRTIHETNWRDYVTLRDAREVARNLLADRPLLLVTGHFGNFELAGYVLGIMGFPTYTIARQLDNPLLDRYVNRLRARTGQYIIPKKGGYDQILSVLKRRGTLSFLADQYAGTRGCWVKFFGRPASAHKAIGLFALTNDAVLLVGSVQRLGRPLRYQFGMEGVADPRSSAPEVQGVRQLTQWYTDRLEQMVRRAPEQYWWLHRRWKDPRPPRRAANQGPSKQAA